MKKMDKVGDTSSKSADGDDYQRQTILNLYNSDIGERYDRIPRYENLFTEL